MRPLRLNTGYLARAISAGIVICLWSIAALFFPFICGLAWGQGAEGAIAAETVSYTSQGLRDPFLSPFETGQRPPESRTDRPNLPQLKVQGMVWDSERPQAIINNRVVEVGVVVEGAEVVDITSEGVYLLYEGRKYVIRPRLSERRK